MKTHCSPFVALRKASFQEYMEYAFEKALFDDRKSLIDIINLLGSYALEIADNQLYKEKDALFVGNSLKNLVAVFEKHYQSPQ